MAIEFTVPATYVYMTNFPVKKILPDMLMEKTLFQLLVSRGFKSTAI